jgi:hypothetical protein
MANTELQTTNRSQIERADTFAPRNIREAFDFADMVLMSGMAPKAYLEIVKDKGSEAARAAVVVAIQFGLECGFQPLQALQCIANINGNPSIWGDGALALVQSSGLMEWIKEEDLEIVKKNKKATCQVKRRGDPEVRTVTFSYEDAEKAGIIKRGVWLTYPHRMCSMRARAFALRDKFPDVLKGLKIAEEVMDYVDPEPQPEQPKIQATIVVPTEKALSTPAEGAQPVQVQDGANQSEAKMVEAQVEKSEGDEIISREEAVAYFKAYSASGWLKEESLAFLKSFNPPYDSSLVIKKKDYDAAMKWASTPRKKVEPQPDENMDSEPTEAWNGVLPTE